MRAYCHIKENELKKVLIVCALLAIAGCDQMAGQPIRIYPTVEQAVAACGDAGLKTYYIDQTRKIASVQVECNSPIQKASMEGVSGADLKKHLPKVVM
jgi:hypothetical protein